MVKNRLSRQAMMAELTMRPPLAVFPSVLLRLQSPTGESRLLLPLPSLLLLPAIEHMQVGAPVWNDIVFKM